MSSWSLWEIFYPKLDLVTFSDLSKTNNIVPFMLFLFFSYGVHFFFIDWYFWSNTFKGMLYTAPVSSSCTIWMSSSFPSILNILWDLGAVVTLSLETLVSLEAACLASRCCAQEFISPTLIRYSHFLSSAF